MARYSFLFAEPLAQVGADDDIRRFLGQVRELGYEGIELNLTRPPDPDVTRLQRWLAESGLSLPSFLTGAAYGEGLCLCSPDSGVRQRTVQRLVEYVDTARHFGAILVVGLLQGLRTDEPDPEAANRRIVGCLRDVAAAAADSGVELVIEPVNHLQVGFNNSVAEVRRLVEAVGSPALGPMVDTIHMNIEDPSLVQPILDCGHNLRHVHLCESNGARFGSGHIDFGAVLQALEEVDYKRFASVKVYRMADLGEAARTSIEYLRAVASGGPTTSSA